MNIRTLAKIALIVTLFSTFCISKSNAQTKEEETIAVSANVLNPATIVEKGFNFDFSFLEMTTKTKEGRIKTGQIRVQIDVDAAKAPKNGEVLSVTIALIDEKKVLMEAPIAHGGSFDGKIRSFIFSVHDETISKIDVSVKIISGIHANDYTLHLQDFYGVRDKK